MKKEIVRAVQELACQFDDAQIGDRLGYSVSGIQKIRLRYKIPSFKAVRQLREQRVVQELCSKYSVIEIAQIKGMTREGLTKYIRENSILTFTDLTGFVKLPDGSLMEPNKSLNHFAAICAENRKGKPQPKVRIHHFNEDFFSVIDTEVKAYCLGLLISDGCVYKNTTSLSMTDPEPVEILADAVGACRGTIEIRPEHGGGLTQFRLRLNSVKMRDDLANLGVRPAKSHVVSLPKIPHGLERHLIRGLWDGDGHISTYAYLSGSRFCMEDTRLLFESNGFKVASKISEYTPNYFRLRILKSYPQSMEWIYRDCQFYLPRKRRYAELHWW